MDQEIHVNLSKADLLSWQNLPMTQLIHNQILNLIRTTILELGDGVVLNTDTPQATAQNYAKVVGYIAGLKAAINIEVEEEGIESKDDT